MMSSARNNILKRIETALEKNIEAPFSEHLTTPFSFQNQENDLTALFTREFKALDGQVIFCSGKHALLAAINQLTTEQNWTHIQCQSPGLLEQLELRQLSSINNPNENEADAGITDCECLVARTGTIVLSSAQASGRVLPVYSPVHLVISSVDKIVFDLGDALNLMKNRYSDQLPSALFFASGPSRTADIEKRLVLGVHGPKEVYLFLMETDTKQ